MSSHICLKLSTLCCTSWMKIIQGISHAFFIAKGYLYLLAISSVTYVCTSYNLVFLNTASYCFKYLNVSLDFSYLSLEYEQILAFS